jgi:hypothetical protein
VNSYDRCGQQISVQRRQRSDASLAGQYQRGEPLNILPFDTVHNDCSATSQTAACALSAHMANYRDRDSDRRTNRDSPDTTAELSETRVMSTPVHPPVQRVDGKNRSRALPFYTYVRMSTPISYSKSSREEKKRTHTCLIKYKYELRVDIRTWFENPVAVWRLFTSTLFFRGWTGVDMAGRPVEAFPRGESVEVAA